MDVCVLFTYCIYVALWICIFVVALQFVCPSGVYLKQGARGWLAFWERKIIPECFRRVRICNFFVPKVLFLQLRKYW